MVYSLYFFFLKFFFNSEIVICNFMIISSYDKTVWNFFQMSAIFLFSLRSSNTTA